MQQTSQIYFNVTAKTEFMQHVRIVGNIPQLGNWNPLKGLVLSTSPDKFPQWFNDGQLEITKGVQFQFKLVIMFGDKPVKWEDLQSQQNRQYKAQYFKTVLKLKFNSVSFTDTAIIKNVSNLESDIDVNAVTKLRKQNFSHYFSDSMISSSSGESINTFKEPEFVNKVLDKQIRKWEKGKNNQNEQQQQNQDKNQQQQQQQQYQNQQQYQKNSMTNDQSQVQQQQFQQQYQMHNPYQNKFNNQQQQLNNNNNLDNFNNQYMNQIQQNQNISEPSSLQNRFLIQQQLKNDPYPMFMQILQTERNESLNNREKYPVYKNYKNFSLIYGPEKQNYLQSMKVQEKQQYQQPQQHQQCDYNQLRQTSDQQLYFQNQNQSQNQNQNAGFQSTPENSQVLQNRGRSSSIEEQLNQESLILMSWASPIKFVFLQGSKQNSKNNSQQNSTHNLNLNKEISANENNNKSEAQNLNQNSQLLQQQQLVKQASNSQCENSNNINSSCNTNQTSQNQIQQINKTNNSIEISLNNTNNPDDSNNNSKIDIEKALGDIRLINSSNSLDESPIHSSNQQQQQQKQFINNSNNPTNQNTPSNSQKLTNQNQSNENISINNSSVSFNQLPAWQQQLQQNMGKNQQKKQENQEKLEKQPRKSKQHQMLKLGELKQIPGFGIKTEADFVYKNKIKVKVNSSDLTISSLYQTFLEKDIKFVWIAHCCNSQFSNKTEEKEFQEFVFQNYKIHLIFYKKEEISVFQRQYLNKMRFKTRNIILLEDDKSWDIYKRINQEFTDVAYKYCVQKSPIFSIYVYDFHLFLVPSHLRDTIKEKQRYDLQKVHITFFMNRAFPSQELFAQLPENSILLHSILFSDTIIFSSHEQLEPFLDTLEKNNLFPQHNSQGLITLGYNGREIVIMLEHPGVNFDMINTAKRELKEQQNTVLEKNKKDKKIMFLAIDFLSESSGFEFTFKAFHKFCKNQREKGVKYKYRLVQIIYQAYDGEFDSEIEEKQYYTKIIQLKKKINSEFKENIIDIQEGKNIDFSELMIKMMTSQFFLKGVLKINANTMHYLYYMAIKYDYTLISTSMVLSFLKQQNCIYIVRILNMNETAEIIEKAVDRFLNDPDLQLKVAYDQSVLKKFCSLKNWIAKVFSQIHKKVKSKNYNSKYIITKEESFCGEQLLKIYESQGNINDLSYEHVKYGYQNSKNSLFIFGYTGVFFEKDEINFDNPNKDMIDHMKTLASNINNTVFIITELDHEIVEQHLGHISNLILITNGGMKIKKNGFCEFQITSLENDNKIIWKPSILSYMRDFVNKTNGSYIVELENEIICNFQNVSTGFAEIQKQELISLLTQYVDGQQGKEVYEGQNIVSVRPSYMSKSLIGEIAIKSTFKTRGKIGFLMCIGGRHKYEEGNQELLSTISYLAFSKETKGYFEINAQKILAFVLSSNQSTNLFTLNDIAEVNECLNYITNQQSSSSSSNSNNNKQQQKQQQQQSDQFLDSNIDADMNYNNDNDKNGNSSNQNNNNNNNQNNNNNDFINKFSDISGLSSEEENIILYAPKNLNKTEKNNNDFNSNGNNGIKLLQKANYHNNNKKNAKINNKNNESKKNNKNKYIINKKQVSNDTYESEEVYRKPSQNSYTSFDEQETICFH